MGGHKEERLSTSTEREQSKTYRLPISIFLKQQGLWSKYDSAGNRRMQYRLVDKEGLEWNEGLGAAVRLVDAVYYGDYLVWRQKIAVNRRHGF